MLLHRSDSKGFYDMREQTSQSCNYNSISPKAVIRTVTGCERLDGADIPGASLHESWMANPSGVEAAKLLRRFSKMDLLKIKNPITPRSCKNPSQTTHQNDSISLAFEHFGSIDYREHKRKT